MEAFWMLLEASEDFWKLVEALWKLLEALWKLSGRFGKLSETSGGFCSFVEAFWKPLDAIFLQFLGPGRGRHTFRGSSADARRMAASVVGASLGRQGGGSFFKTSKNPSSASTVWGIIKCQCMGASVWACGAQFSRAEA